MGGATLNHTTRGVHALVRGGHVVERDMALGARLTPHAARRHGTGDEAVACRWGQGTGGEATAACSRGLRVGGKVDACGRKTWDCGDAVACGMGGGTGRCPLR